MSSGDHWKKVVLASSLFHILLLVVGIAWYFLDWKPKPKEEPIWVEMVELSQPSPVESEPEPVPEEPEEIPEEEVSEEVELPEEPSEPEPVEPEPVREPKPKPEIKPEPKPKPPKPKPKPPKPKPITPKKAEPVKDTVAKDTDWDMPDFDEIKAKQSLQRVQESYLGRVKGVIDRFWRPPLGLPVSSGTKVIYKFVILKNGQITNIKMSKSSGNTQLDELGKRALQKSKLPPLPPQMGQQWSVEYGFVYESR